MCIRSCLKWWKRLAWITLIVLSIMKLIEDDVVVFVFVVLLCVAVLSGLLLLVTTIHTREDDEAHSV